MSVEEGGKRHEKNYGGIYGSDDAYDNSSGDGGL